MNYLGSYLRKLSGKSFKNPSEKVFDVLILSAWGRGFEFALDLLQLKKKIAFVDLSDGIFPSSKVSEEDLSGPFGCFFTEKLKRRKTQWMLEPSGFSVRSQKNYFHFRELLLFPVYQKRKEFQELLRSSKSTNFQNDWLKHLICKLRSGVSDPSRFDFGKKSSMSFVFKEFGVLKGEKWGTHVLEKLKKQRIFVFKANEFKFFKKENRVSFKNGENFKAQSVVCFLNPDELNKVFDEKIVCSNWAWRRFPFEQKGSENFPLYTVLADPSNLPWTHDRLLCLKKSFTESQRINVWGIFPKNIDLSNSVKRITDTLNKFFPDFGWKFSGKLSPSFLFPVYSTKQYPFKNYGWLHAWPFENLSENGRITKELELLSKIK